MTKRFNRTGNGIRFFETADDFFEKTPHFELSDENRIFDDSDYEIRSNY